MNSIHQDKVLSALALAKRAGKLVMGFDAVMKSAQKNETKFVLLSESLSEKTVKEAHFRCKNLPVTFGTAPVTMERAEKVLGKSTGIFGITDSGFIRLIEKYIQPCVDCESVEQGRTMNDH